MDRLMASAHRHSGDLSALLLCPDIIQRVEAISKESNFSQACQVMEYFLLLHDRYKEAKGGERIGMISETDIIAHSGSKGRNLEMCESMTCVPFDSYKNGRDLLTMSTGSDDVPVKVVNKCPKCSAQFQSRLKLQFHLTLKHQQSSQNAQLGQESQLSSIISCPFCGKMFLNSKTLNFHKHICLSNHLLLEPSQVISHHRIHKRPMKIRQSINNKFVFSYICSCGQHFSWKSLYLHHKKICKTRRKFEKGTNHYHHKMARLHAKADTECTDLSGNNSMKTNLCENLSAEETINEDTVRCTEKECPIKRTEDNDHSPAYNDTNSILEKNDIVPFDCVDKSINDLNCKSVCLEDQGKGHLMDSESNGSTRFDYHVIKEYEVKSGLVIKREPLEDNNKMENTEHSQEAVEDNRNVKLEEVCSMEDGRKSQLITDGTTIVPEIPEENADHETFYMEDEVAVVDLSNMKVSMNCPRVQGENMVPLMSNKAGEKNQLYPTNAEVTGHISSDKKEKEDQQVLNLSNKPDFREDGKEMQMHYKHRSGEREGIDMVSQCPNCLCTYKSSQDLLLHIQNSHCRFVFDFGNTKTTHHRICRICNVTLKNFYAFIQHLYERHGIQGIYDMKQNSQVKPCKICGQKFLSEAYLREHVQGKHSSVRRYACTCGKTFKWRSSFSGHRRNCSGTISCINKPYPTTMCRYTRKRQGLTLSSNYLPTPVVPRQEREDPVQMTSNNRTGKIPGVHTILNNLKDKLPQLNTADGFKGLNSKDQSPMPPRAHGEVTSQKPISKPSTNSLKTDLNSPATQKIIESLKQRANVKWPTNKSSPSSFPKPDLKTSSPQPPHSMTTVSDPPKPNMVSTAPAASYQKGLHSTPSSQTDSNSTFLSSSGSPYGMVFPVGDSMANMTQYLQYQNSFGFNALSMQQLYHQMSASLSKIFSPENVKGKLNDKGLNKSTEKSSRENSMGQYASRTLSKSRDITDQDYTGSNTQKKTTLPSQPHHGVSLNCPTCKTSFADKISMEMHILKCKNRPMTMYTCSICGMKLRGKASLREHTLGKHSATRYACSCGMKFKWRSSLGSHQKHCDDFMKKFY